MAMLRTPFNLGTLPAPDAAFSRGLELRLGAYRVMFVSGTASIGPDLETLYPGDFEKQVRHTYENIADLLAARGASLSDVVKWTVFLREMSRYDTFCRIRHEIYAAHGVGRENYAASTCVEARLCRPDLEVMLDAIAITEAD